MTTTQEEVHKLDPAVRAPYLATPKVVLTPTSYAAIRAAYLQAPRPPTPEGIEIVDVAEDGVEGLIVRKKGAAPDAPLLVWFHGGGYVFGYPRIHAPLYFKFVEAGITVFAPRYGLAPEVPFPKCHDDAMKAWEWVVSGAAAKSHAIGKGKLALGGTSAGAGLAASTALRLRDLQHASQPLVLVLNIPWVARPPKTPDALAPSWHAIKFDNIWSLSNAFFAEEAYFPPGTEDPEKYAFPLEHASLHGLPPTLVSVSEKDILRDSGIRFAQRVMAESEAGAELHVFKGAYHGSNSAAPNARISQLQDTRQVTFVCDTLEMA